MSIQPIETFYNGIMFRSRLEARWAVAFDTLGIRWQYEPERFAMGGVDKTYLPDFFLPQTKTWVEVKGSLDMVDDAYLQMLIDGMDFDGCLPHVSDSLGSTRGLLWLGNIPDTMYCEHNWPMFPIVQHDEGVWASLAYFACLVPLRYNDVTVSVGRGGSYLREYLVKYADGTGNREIPTERPANYAVQKAFSAARSARF